MANKKEVMQNPSEFVNAAKTPEQRLARKRIVHGLLYGMGVKALRMQYQIKSVVPVQKATPSQVVEVDLAKVEKRLTVHNSAIQDDGLFRCKRILKELPSTPAELVQHLEAKGFNVQGTITGRASAKHSNIKEIDRK